MRTIIPAVLENDLGSLKKRIKQFEKLSKTIQIDIADGKFVKNKTVGVLSLPKIKSKSNLEFHLMVANPKKFITLIPKASVIAVHCEIYDFRRHIDSIIKRKINAAAAINSETDIARLVPVIKKIKKVIVMTVSPGRQGGKFIPESLDKIKQIKKLNKNIIIQVDGGINEQTIKLAEKAGADEFVVGSALIKADNAKKEYQTLQKL